MEISNLPKTFKKSANELKSVRCICVTGVLIACYVVLNAFLAPFNVATLKITFGYLALAIIGMLYGPVVAIIAAVPCDIVTALFKGNGIDFVFTLPKLLEGLIYGLFLYERFAGLPMTLGAKKAAFLAERAFSIIMARALAVVLCYLVLNSFLIYYVTGAVEDSFEVFMFARYAKNAIQFPVDLILMFTLLPIAGKVYNKINSSFGKERGIK